MDRVTLITLILCGIFLLFSLIFISVKVAPLFTCCFLALVIASLLFVSTEHSGTHAATEFENRFWSLMVFLFLVTLSFTPDSPFAFSGDYGVFTWFIICALTFAFHNYDRHLVRLRLMKLPKLKKSLSSEFGSETSKSAKVTVAKLQELAACIDGLWFSSAFVNVFALPKVLMSEEEIINIFRTVDGKQLNYILDRFPIAHLFYKIKDHWYVQKNHRTELLELLTVDRLSELTVRSRALLLHGLQLKKLSATAGRSELFVKNILLRTTGDQLSELKCLTDSKGDYNSMHKLIYRDIRNDSIRNEILRHFAKQAMYHAAHCSIRSTQGKRRMQLYAWRKIVSDVDDTLLCSGGSFPAGMDRSYPKKELYPGVIAFLRELDLGLTGRTVTVKPKGDSRYQSSYKSASLTSSVNLSVKSHTPVPPTDNTSNMLNFKEPNWVPQSPLPAVIASNAVSAEAVSSENTACSSSYIWEEDRLSNLVFLSARPHVYSDLSEQLTYDKFDQLRKSRGLHGNPTLLVGALDTGTSFIIRNDMEPLARTKFQNYCEFCAIYPEFKYVLIGDNGQGDVRVAEMVLSSPEQSLQRASLERVYIHLVQPLELTHVQDPAIRTSRFAGINKHICYFDTYIDAAIDACMYKLISYTGLKNVVEEAKRDFACIASTAWSAAGIARSKDGKVLGGGRLRNERLQELNRAINKANDILSLSDVSPCTLLRYSQKFKRGICVRCDYGVGIVDGFRSADGMYVVLLSTDTVKAREDSVGVRLVKSVSFTRLYVQGLQLHGLHSGSREKSNSLQSIILNPASVDCKTNQTLSAVPVVNTSLVGYLVWTPFDKLATVIGVRPREGIIICKLSSWNATCYLHASSVVLLQSPNK